MKVAINVCSCGWQCPHDAAERELERLEREQEAEESK